MTRETTLARVDRARRALSLGILARAVLVSAAVGGVAFLLLLAADLLVGLSIGVRAYARWIAIFAGAMVLNREFYQRVYPALSASAEKVALWFEGRLPALKYALVTAVGDAGAPAQLHHAVAMAPLEQETRRATIDAVRRPAMLVIAVLLGFVIAPSGAIARVAAPRAGDSLDRPGVAARAATDPLAAIVVRVEPPAYTGLPARTVDDPSAVSALVGGRIVIEGLGADVHATVGSAEHGATRAGDRWQIGLAVPAEAVGVRLRGPSRERVLVIEPVADSVPAVRIDLPARDSVLRVATGTIRLEGAVRDDHGLASAAFEYIVSSGAGETFTFRNGSIAAQRFAAATRDAKLSASLSLDSLKLAPGDLIHLRAVAADRNDVTGPGVGASETRTLRVARADEYDSVAVDPMPPTEPEKNALSQRMILQLTMELRARERRIGPTETTRESRKLALEQTKLRKRVGEIVFTRLSEDQGEHAHFAGDGHEHGAERPVDPDAVLAAAERAANADRTLALEGEQEETPIVAINRPLLEAYNHMWQASTELETGAPGRAIPWMERAIEALQRARAAERIYLRGRPPRVVIDLARVRMSGKEKSAATARQARAPLDPEHEARLVRFDSVLATVVAAPLDAADALLLLRLTLPVEERAAADALTGAADAVRRGGDVTVALQRARRALAGAPQRSDALGPWGR